MDFNNIPKTISFDGEKLLEIKAKLAEYPEEAKVLTERAEKLLDTRIYSVVYKELVPVSNDPHDYMTMGTYWWPDPDKPDGLPYIRKDGYVNPQAKDRNSYGAMSDAAFNLAYAAYLFDREDYAKKAVEFLSAWHLDEETKMNPHAEYSQAIPGICEGRGIGIIDFRTSYKVFDAVEILYAIGALTEEQYSGLLSWYVAFGNWLITSEKGIFIDNYFNNHGTWYDVQLLSVAKFTNRPELAKRVALSSYGKRLSPQVMADGAQPHELARTQAMSYSMMNLVGLTRIAKYCVKLGRKEYASEDPEKGVFLLGKATDFLYPYVTDQSEFGYPQIHPTDTTADIAFVLRSLTEITGDSSYAEKAEKFDDPKYLIHLMPI